MLIKSYKELGFWQNSKTVSLLVISLIKKFPQNRASWIISDQLLRASFSIGANIAEGFGRFKGKEYARFIRIALGSANEVEYWLELSKDIVPSLMEEINVILDKNKATIKMLTATLSSLRKRNKN